MAGRRTGVLPLVGPLAVVTAIALWAALLAGAPNGRASPYSEAARTEAALTVPFLIDDAYQNLNPRGQRYKSIKRLSDSEVTTFTLFQ